jgi:hypothetical protein
MKQDIGVTSNGYFTLVRKDNGKLDYTIVTGSDYVRQKLEIELRLFKDECFTDMEQGIDWWEYMSSKDKYNELNAIIKDKIAKIDGVEKIIEYETSFDNEDKNYYINFSVQYNGEIINNISFGF